MRLSVAAVALIVAVVVGCRPSAPAGHRSPVLRLVIPDELKTLDPAHAYDTYSSAVSHAICAGLVDYDEGTSLVPDLAAGWEISDQGRRYEFTLRPGVRFSTGAPVTSEDCRASLERVMRPETASNVRSFLAGIVGAREVMEGRAGRCTGIATPAADRLVIRLKEPSPTFLYVLAMNLGAILPRDTARRPPEEVSWRPIGAGPYRVARWDGTTLTLAPNPHHPDATQLRPIALETRASDPALMMARFAAGEVHVLPLVPPAELARVRHDPALRGRFLEKPVNQTWYLGMNTRMKPFDDARVRRAVSLAINRQRQAQLEGAGVVATGMLPPTMPGHDPDLVPDPHDPRRARELLAEAGHWQGLRTTMWITPSYRRRAEAIQADLRAVGIEVELRVVDLPTYLDGYKRENTAPCWYGGWYPDYPDPSSFLEVLFHSRNISPTKSLNATRYSNPEVDRLLDRAARMPLGEARLALYREAERRILADAPVVPLYYEVETRLWQPGVEGVEIHPVWRYLRLGRLRLR